MAPRPRKAGSKDLPDNLYSRTDKRNGVTYYRYRDPVSGKELGLGSDRTMAIKLAKVANQERVAGPISIMERLNASTGILFSAWLDEYRVIIQERGLAVSSLRNMRMRINTLSARFGDQPIDALDTKAFAAYFKEMTSAGKRQMSKVMRSLLKDIFREAIAVGHVKENPIAVTKAPRLKIERERMSLEMWQGIYARVTQPWALRAMELSLVLGQRREDIARIKFSDIKDGKLHIIQGKTKTKLRFDLDWRLDSIGLSLGDIVKRCRDNVVSPYLVHHSKATGRALAGEPIKMLDTLSSVFATARDEYAAEAGIAFGKRPPSWHEQRSLAERLHAAEGHDTQRMLGHKSATMTAVYKDVRGSEWLDVSTK